MRYERVKVKRDTQTTYCSLTRPWEVPILEHIFEEGNVERMGEFEQTAHPYPDPAEEFKRLVDAYGADSKSGIPFAVQVLGDSRRGVRELRKLIDEAKAAEAAAEPRSSKRKTRASAAADPLMN